MLQVSPLARLSGHISVPLYRNGYALILSSLATSALGLIYWVMAARYYSAATVGLNSAILSAMLFLSAVAQLNLGGMLVRFVPLAGKATGLLIGWSYLASLIAAVLVAVVFVLGLNFWSPSLLVLRQDPALLAWFILATMTWSIFTLQDSALTGLRQTVWVPLENTVFALAKIGLLIFFAATFPAQGIFASWTVPIAAALIPVNWFIFRRFIPQHIRETSGRAIPIVARRVIRFASGNYIGAIFYQATTTLLPIIVLNRLGAVETAYFYLPWTITVSLQMVSLNMAASFTVEASHDETKLNALCSHVLIHNLKMLVPLVAVIVVGAPYILGIFGATYAAEGTPVLRLLALSVIPYSLTSIYVGLARVQNRVHRIAIIQVVRCVLVLALSYYLLPVLGITGVGLVWLIIETLIGGFLFFTELRPILRHRGGDTPLREYDMELKPQ